MERIFYAAPVGDYRHGEFGTLFACASFILRSEGIDTPPDPDDPIESLTQLLESNNVKYALESAEAALPKLLELDEALRLKSLPQDLKVSEVYDWLEAGDYGNEVRKEMVDLLHGRVVHTRWRGQMHTVGNSPFTPAVYDALLAQLS